jgi:Spy/CpxP family protein refolding chaperone
MLKPNLLLIAVLVVPSLLSSHRALAQNSASQPPRRDSAPRGSANGDNFQGPSDQDIQLLRKDLRSQKKQMVAANMDLTDAQAEKFWPIYDQYTTDLARINDAKAGLIKDYVQDYSTMNGDQAESYIRERVAVEEQVMQLRLKYIPTFRKVLSGRQTALFFQIEYRLGLMVDLQLAQMPLIDP